MPFILQHKTCSPGVLGSNAKAQSMPFPWRRAKEREPDHVSCALQRDQSDGVAVTSDEMHTCARCSEAKQAFIHGEGFCSTGNTCLIGAFILICSFMGQA